MRWRTTTASTFIASIVFAVSMTVSPLETLLPDDENSMVSPPRRRAASEKLLRVRVLLSKNKFASVRPLRTWIFCRQPSVASLKASDVSRMQFSSSAERLSKSRRCRRVQTAGTVPKSKVALFIRHLATPAGFKIWVILAGEAVGE